MIYVYDEETVFRIVPLGAQMFDCVAVFVDLFSHRGSVLAAAKTFHLSRREAQVLRLLISGKSNAHIAATLFVADSTVSDHVKSVMRKMGVSKRLEILSKVFHLEHDVTDERF